MGGIIKLSESKRHCFMCEDMHREGRGFEMFISPVGSKQLCGYCANTIRAVVRGHDGHDPGYYSKILYAKCMKDTYNPIVMSITGDRSSRVGVLQ